MIGGKDDAVLTCCTGSVSEQMNLFRVSGMEELNITTVNVHHMSIVTRRKQLKELLAKLFCKKNTRSNNNKSLTMMPDFHVSNGIINHTNGLATTGRDDHLTFVVLPHRIDCFTLVWSKGDGQVVSVSMNIL